MQYDIIIPSSIIDVKFLKWVIKYIRKNLIEAKNIYIITKKEGQGILEGFKINNVFFVDEDALFEGLSFSKVHVYLKDKGYEVHRTGWYFQQFLKMAFSLSKYCEGYYLSWDSDTLPLSHIQFFENEHPVFTLKKEYHKPYFATINRLIGLKKIRQESFIAEHMIFSREVMNELIANINQKDSTKIWWQVILDNIEVTGEGNYFSEFETYGTFVTTNYPDLYKFQRLNTFRSAGLIKGRHIDDNLIERLSVDLDIASFEIQDQRFPYNFEKIQLKISQKFKKIFK